MHDEKSDKRLGWPFWLAIVTLVVAILGLVPAYFIFWHKSDLVFDKRAVEIPLSDTLKRELSQPHTEVENVKRGVAINFKSVTLPDKLFYVNIRNVGHVPTSTIRVRLQVPGAIADKDLKGAGPALGDIQNVRTSDNEVYFECPGLANQSSAVLRTAIWYQKTKDDAPVVEVTESSEGAAREVGSVDSAKFYLVPDQIGGWFAILSAGLIGPVIIVLIEALTRALRSRWVR